MITLSNITEYSKQEVFNRVYKHLLTQNAKSKTEELGCVYRGENRLCAVGCIISDEEYTKDMEGEAIYFSFFDKYFMEDSNNIRGLLEKLQDIHDLVDVVDWKEELAKLAEEESLCI